MKLHQVDRVILRRDMTATVTMNATQVPLLILAGWTLIHTFPGPAYLLMKPERKEHHAHLSKQTH